MSYNIQSLKKGKTYFAKGVKYLYILLGKISQIFFIKSSPNLKKIKCIPILQKKIYKKCS